MRPVLAGLVCGGCLALGVYASEPDGGTTDVGEVVVIPRDGGPVTHWLILLVPAPVDHDCRPKAFDSACDI